MSDFLQPHGLYSSRNSPSQNSGVGNLSLLQGIFATQGSNPGLLHCRQILYQLSYQGTYSFPNFEPVCCSMSGSNCCFLTCIQVLQEAGKVVWYYHFFKNFPQFVVIHKLKGFPYVVKFKSEFCNKEFMIWAKISSWSCFCWLCRAPPSSATKNIINLLSISSIWRCPCVVMLYLGEKWGLQPWRHTSNSWKTAPKRQWKWSHSVVSYSLWPHELWPTRLLHPWDFPRRRTGVSCHLLLQGILPTQASNPGLPHCRQTLYHLSHQGSHGGSGRTGSGSTCKILVKGKFSVIKHLLYKRFSAHQEELMSPWRDLMIF